MLPVGVGCANNRGSPYPHTHKGYCANTFCLPVYPVLCARILVLQRSPPTQYHTIKPTTQNKPQSINLMSHPPPANQLTPCINAKQFINLRGNQITA